jgi:hypothetical protein
VIELATIVAVGVVASVAVLLIAPVLLVYFVAFIALTPILGTTLWLMRGLFRDAIQSVRDTLYFMLRAANRS